MTIPHVRRAIGLSVVAGLAACGDSSRPPRSAGTPQASAPAPLTLPATFTGDLPCGGCEATATTLTLFDDGTFRLRSVPRGANAGAASAALGTWRALDGGRRYVLDGAGQGARQFGRIGADSLRLLDNTGAEMVAPLPYRLGRAASVDTIRDRMRFEGAVLESADAVRLIDCASGRGYPVLREGAFDALGRGVRQAQAGRAQPTSALVLGRLRARPPELPGKGEVLAVDSVERVWVGGACGAGRPRG